MRCMADEVTVIKVRPRHSLEEIGELAAGPLRAARAERAVVFGSWARGTADGFSDLDLAVVLETDLPRLERPRRLTALLDALPLAVDLLVYTPEEFERGLREGFGVFDAIAREGITIYARSEQ
jgi:predicted nucleotidyltransferase